MPSLHRRPRELGRAVALASLACLALGILGVLDAATHVERYTEVRVVDPWKEQGTFVYEPLLADGTGALPMGEPGYFTHDAPTMRVRFTWGLDDPAAERVTALATLKLVLSHPASPGRAAWTHAHEIASVTHVGAAADPLVLEGVVDLPAIAQAATGGGAQRRVEDADWSFVASVRFESAPNAAHRADASEYTLPLTYAEPLYVLPAEGDAVEVKDHAQREASTREAVGGAQAVLADPGALLLLALGVVGLAWSLPRLDRPDDHAEEASA